MFRRLLTRTAPLCVLALMGCGAAPATVGRPAPEPEQTLRPGDIVKLVVWREEDLTGEFMVDLSGQVVLPQVGKWDVGEETESTLEDRLTTALAEELRGAAIDVIVLRRIQVVGAVEEPGLYTLDNTMTLGDALASAGGVGPTARRDRVEVVRGGERYIIPIGKDRTLTDLPLRSGDSVYVPERNWFLRNYGATLTGLTSLVGLAAVIISTSN